MNNIYYVYGLVDPRNNEVFYIGKGKGNRSEQHFKEEYTETKGNRGKINRIKDIQSKTGKNPTVKYYARGIEEAAAYALEEILIDKIGRKLFRFGPLTNWLVGGEKESQFKFGLKEGEKMTIDIVRERFPEILEAINKVPRTTKEDKLRDNMRKTVQKVILIINKFDSKIIEDIEATNIRYEDTYRGIAIQFDCKYGSGSITYDDDNKFDFDEGSSTVVLIDNNPIFLERRTILFKSSLFKKDVTAKLREFHEEQEK